MKYLNAQALKASFTVFLLHSHGSHCGVPDRPGEDAAAEPAYERDNRWTHVQKQHGLLQEGDPSRGHPGTVPWPRAPTCGRRPWEGHQTYRKTWLLISCVWNFSNPVITLVKVEQDTRNDAVFDVKIRV